MRIVNDGNDIGEPIVDEAGDLPHVIVGFETIADDDGLLGYLFFGVKPANEFDIESQEVSKCTSWRSTSLST